MKEDALHRLIREIAQADSNSKPTDCRAEVSGTCVPLASAWNYSQHCRALIQLGDEGQYKFINSLCVTRQENNDFVSFYFKGF